MCHTEDKIGIERPGKVWKVSKPQHILYMLHIILSDMGCLDSALLAPT